MSEPLSREDVLSLAATAGLALDEDRVGPIADLLGVWLPAANSLSVKMSAAEHVGVVPITVLVHPRPTEQGE